MWGRTWSALVVLLAAAALAYPTRYEAFLERENVYGPGRPDGVNPSPRSGP